MSEMLKKYGGLILFYGIIILGVILLNERCRYLKELNKMQNLTKEIIVQVEGSEYHV